MLYSLLNLALSLCRWKLTGDFKSHTSEPFFLPLATCLIARADTSFVYSTIIYQLSVMCPVLCQGLSRCLPWFCTLKLLSASLVVEIYCLLLCGECLYIISFNLCNNSKRQVMWLPPSYRGGKKLQNTAWICNNQKPGMTASRTHVLFFFFF